MTFAPTFKPPSNTGVLTSAWFFRCRGAQSGSAIASGGTYEPEGF